MERDTQSKYYVKNGEVIIKNQRRCKLNNSELIQNQQSNYCKDLIQEKQMKYLFL